MGVKKFVNFIIPLRAMSPRNLTSLGLVALFFAIYVLSGGKVQSIPKSQDFQSFGMPNNKIKTTGDVRSNQAKKTNEIPANREISSLRDRLNTSRLDPSKLSTSRQTNPIDSEQSSTRSSYSSNQNTMNQKASNNLNEASSDDLNSNSDYYNNLKARIEASSKKTK